MPTSVVIRNAKYRDREAIIEICYETRSVEVAIEDKSLFAYRWALDYLEQSPDVCYVAELEGQVVGYLVATPNTELHNQCFLRKWGSGQNGPVEQQHPLRQMLTTPDDFGPLWRQDLAKYPAHLHMNLTAKCQGQGVGASMVKALEAKLVSQGIPGIHLGVGIENDRAVRFYQRQGYQLMASSPLETMGTWVLAKSLTQKGL